MPFLQHLMSKALQPLENCVRFLQTLYACTWISIYLCRQAFRSSSLKIQIEHLKQEASRKSHIFLSHINNFLVAVIVCIVSIKFIDFIRDEFIKKLGYFVLARLRFNQSESTKMRSISFHEEQEEARKNSERVRRSKQLQGSPGSDWTWSWNHRLPNHIFRSIFFTRHRSNISESEV